MNDLLQLGVLVEARPGLPFVMIQAQLFMGLLARLLVADAGWTLPRMFQVNIYKAAMPSKPLELCAHMKT